MKRPVLAWTFALLLTAVPGVFAQKLKVIATIQGGQDFKVGCVALSPNGKILAIDGIAPRGSKLKLWEVASGKVIVTIATDDLTTMTFSPDGKFIATADRRHRLTVWDVTTTKPRATFNGRSDDLVLMAFSSDSKILALAGRKVVRIWDIAKGKVIISFQRTIGVYQSYGMAFTRDLKLLASPNFQEIDLWDVVKGKDRAILSEHREEVGCVTFSADEKTLVAASSRSEGRWGYAGQIKLWNVATSKERATLKGKFGYVGPMALSPDAKTLALLNWDDIEADTELRVLNVATGRVLLSHRGEVRSLHSLQYLADGRLFVTEILDQSVKLWVLAPPKK